MIYSLVCLAAVTLITAAVTAGYRAGSDSSTSGRTRPRTLYRHRTRAGTVAKNRWLSAVILATLILSLAYRGHEGIDTPVHAEEINPDTYPAGDADPDATDPLRVPDPDLGTHAKNRPVLFIHGLDGLDAASFDAGSDCLGDWGQMRDKLWNLGWDPDHLKGVQYSKFRYISYYYGDTRCSVHNGDDTTIEHHGSRGTINGHYIHNGRTSTKTNGHVGKGHDNDAWIQHLSYHLAWYIYDHYTKYGKVVTVVAHSMGGLITNYALLKAHHDQPDFPKVLYVGQVITMGTPHTGSTPACYAGAADAFQGSQQCPNPVVTDYGDPRTFLPWLDQYGRDPDGSNRFPTEWTLMGSIYDDAVTDFSARGLPYNCPYRGCDWYRTPAHWVSQQYSTTYVQKVDHSDYKKDVAHPIDREAVWRNRGDAEAHYDPTMGHCVRWADAALSTTSW